MSIAFSVSQGALEDEDALYLRIVAHERKVYDCGFPISLASIGAGGSEGGAAFLIATKVNRSAH